MGALCAASAAAPARAFERQWHFGGGLGVAAPGESYSTGPAVGVHAAYGLSDVFDARIELQGSRHDAGDLPVIFYAGRAALAYKVDVMEWIPYAGVSAGATLITWSQTGLVRPSAGGLVGLDYAASRHVGIGVLGAGDYVFVDSGLTIFSLLVRAEYRFGW
jgi:hypothetical protein